MNEPPTSQPTSRLEVRIGLVVVALFAITAVGAIWFKVKHTWSLAWDRLRSPVAVLDVPDIDEPRPTPETFLEPALTPKADFPGGSPLTLRPPENEFEPSAGSPLTDTPEPPLRPFEYFPNPQSLEVGKFGVEPTSATGTDMVSSAQDQGTTGPQQTPAEDALPPHPIASAFATTPILPNDTIWLIAERQYASSQFAHALWRHNQRDFSSPSDLPAGHTIEIPTADYLRRTYPETFTSTASNAVTETTPPPGQQYVIRDGDTLFTIARVHLGATQRWVELFRLNREIVGDDPTKLPVGQVLALPAAQAARS